MGCTMMGGLAAWPLLGSIIGLVVLAVVIAGGIWLGRRLLDATSQPVNDQPGQVDADSAREVLRRRYAAGEIDDEEFERRLASLNPH
jgi:putative membrane protein